MLTEETVAFARDNNNIGSAEDLQMKLYPLDTIPVQRTYTSIPKPLYKEVREHIEDMLVKGWIRKSKSAYSYPLVCMRKKDGSLRICVDFCQVPALHMNYLNKQQERQTFKLGVKITHVLTYFDKFRSQLQKPYSPLVKNQFRNVSFHVSMRSIKNEQVAAYQTFPTFKSSHSPPTFKKCSMWGKNY